MFEILQNIRFFSCHSYGNTHSETSLCAQQTTRFREEARSIIKKSVNANDDDVLLFVGTGSTGAVHALVDNFDFHDESIKKKTIVMVSAFEHHSNILPWQEVGVEVRIRIFVFDFCLSVDIYLDYSYSNNSKWNPR